MVRVEMLWRASSPPLSPPKKKGPLPSFIFYHLGPRGDAVARVQVARGRKHVRAEGEALTGGGRGEVEGETARRKDEGREARVKGRQHGVKKAASEGREARRREGSTA